MAVPGYTNTEERECSACWRFFTKGTKERKVAAKGAHPAAATTGVSVPGKGGGPQGGVHLAKEGSPRRKGKSETATREGARDRRAAPGLTPKQSPWYPVAGRRKSWAGGPEGQGPLSDQGPTKSKDLSRTAQFLGQHEAVI